MVAFISRKCITAVFSSEVYMIYPRDQPVINLGSKQVVIVIGNAIHYWVKLAGHPKEVLVMRMNMTTSVWRLASATSTNRMLLFLVGEGHHW